eukprot:PhF_6_TR41336/c2_g1_i1/m.62706
MVVASLCTNKEDRGEWVPQLHRTTTPQLECNSRPERHQLQSSTPRATCLNMPQYTTHTTSTNTIIINIIPMPRNKPTTTMPETRTPIPSTPNRTNPSPPPRSPSNLCRTVRSTWAPSLTKRCPWSFPLWPLGYH